MKFVAVFALMLVAVSASYYFKQPKYPCAYQLKLKPYADKKEIGKLEVAVNGRYFKMEYKVEDYNLVLLFRPDLADKGNVTIFEYDIEEKECYSEEMEMEEASYFINLYGQGLLEGADGRNWEKKKSEEWRGKKCDHYYNDDDDEGIYVYDDHVYGLVEHELEIVYEYEWEAPMEEFVMKEKDYPQCVKENKKVAEEPSKDYVFCAASSLKVAFAAILAALLAALF